MVLEKVKETIQEHHMIESGDHIIIAVSGGPDSMCLLDNMRKIQKENLIGIPFSIGVAHVNHGIREEAEKETDYVIRYCLQYNIPYHIKKVNVIQLAKQKKIGLEEAGRNVRYTFFEELIQQKKATKIAVAHNENDNVETILMHLLRGSGPNGLRGMEYIRNGKYIRPLIEVPRNEIEEYCRKEKIDPKIDKSNLDNTYTRNKIRNQLIPMLEKEFNPNIIQTIERLSKILAEEQNFLEKIVHTIYNQILIEENQKEIILDVKEFNKQDIVIKRRIVLYTINRLFHTTNNIEKIHIEDIIRLCNKNIGNKYLTPNKQIKVFLKKGKISFISIV